MTREDQKSIADLVEEKRRERPVHVHDDGTADDDPNCPAWPAMTENRVPTTEAGRALAARLHGDEPGGTPHGGEVEDAILAIEAAAVQPAPPLDVERLAFGIFMSTQPRTLRQWEEAPEAVRDHYRRRADSALYHARLGSEAP